LINAGDARTAAAHLAPLVYIDPDPQGRNSGMLSRDAVAHNTYANALINAGDARTAAAHLEPLVRTGGLLASNPVAHNTYANALINAGDARTAAAHLAPLVYIDPDPQGRNSGMLSRDAVAHTTYANALINAGDARTAAAHLEPLVRTGGMLNRDAAIIYSLCKALYMADRKNHAIEYGMQFIRDTQGHNEKSHIIGVGIMLAIFDEGQEQVVQLCDDLSSRYGPFALESAKHVAAIWRQGDLITDEGLTSGQLYGSRGTPLAVIADGGHRPISISDGIKAGVWGNG
jgi:tetratricopeptide (TPR) repeat protein